MRLPREEAAGEGTIFQIEAHVWFFIEKPVPRFLPGNVHVTLCDLSVSSLRQESLSRLCLNETAWGSWWLVAKEVYSDLK